MKRLYFILIVLFITIFFITFNSCSSYNAKPREENLYIIDEKNKNDFLKLYKSYLNGAFVYLKSRNKSIIFKKEEIKNFTILKEILENVKTNDEMINYMTEQINNFLTNNNIKLLQQIEDEFNKYFSNINIEELNISIRNNNHFITQFIYNNIKQNTEIILENKIKELDGYNDVEKKWNNMCFYYKGMLINQNNDKILMNFDNNVNFEKTISQLYYMKIKNELIAGETLAKGNKL